MSIVQRTWARLLAKPLWAWAGIAMLSVAAVGAALVSQHVFDMQPCPWCTLQRVIFLAIAGVALVGALWRGPWGQRLTAGLTAALAGSGVAAALWQLMVASSSLSCNLTFADHVLMALHLPSWAPEVFEPRASCAEASVNLLGLPYAVWSLALFVVLAAAAIGLLVRAIRAQARPE
jgi:disulfide bond formation protein DsbB